MLGYQYTYSTLEEILLDINIMGDMGIPGIILLIFFCFLLIISVCFIIPAIMGLYHKYRDKKQKEKRKSLLLQISTQREIEEEIEKEIQMEEESKINI